MRRKVFWSLAVLAFIGGGLLVVAGLSRGDNGTRPTSSLTPFDVRSPTPADPSPPVPSATADPVALGTGGEGSAGVGDRTSNGVRLDVGLVPLSPRDNPATTSSPPPMKASTASDQKTFRRIALALLLHALFYRTETRGRCGP